MKLEAGKRVVPAIAVGAALVLLLAGGVLAAAFALVDSSWLRSRVESEISGRIGHEVRIGDMQVDLGRLVRVSIENLEVANPSWAASPVLFSVQRLEFALVASALLRGDVVLRRLHASRPFASLERSPQGRTNWSPSRPQHGPAAEDKGGFALPVLPRIDEVSVDNGRLAYRDPSRASVLQLEFGGEAVAGGSGHLQLTGHGHLFAEPVQLVLRGGSPLKMIAGSGRTPLRLEASSGDAALRLDGEVDALLAPRVADFVLEGAGDSMRRWLTRTPAGSDARPLPYRFSSRISLADGTWTLHEISSRVGDSDISGALEWATGHSPALLTGDLRSRRLDLPQLTAALSTGTDTPPADPLSRMVDGLRALKLSAQVAMRAQRIVTETAVVHDASLAIALAGGELEVESFAARIGAGHIGGGARLSTRTEPLHGELWLRVQDAGVAALLAAVQRPAGPSQISGARLDGEVSLSFEAARENGEAAQADLGDAAPLEFTRLQLESLALRYAAQPDTTIAARLQPGRAAGESPELVAEGTYRGAPLSLSLAYPGLKDLQALRAASGPLQPLQATLRLGASQLAVSGSLAPDWPPDRLNLDVTGQSKAPSEIAALFGLEIPRLGPLSVGASILGQAQRWQLTGLRAQLGPSDLRGTATIDASDTSLGVRLRADLASTMLDLDSIPGGIPDTAARPARAQALPVAVATPAAEPADTPAWPAINGTARWTIQDLVVADVSIPQVGLEARFEGSKAWIPESTFSIAGGQVSLQLALDLQARGLAGDMSVEVDDVDLSRAMRARDVDAHGLGSVSGQLAISLRAARGRNANALRERLAIDRLHVRYRNPDRGASTDLRLVAGGLGAPARFRGKLALGGEPFELSLRTGSLTRMLERPASLPLHVRLGHGQTEVRLETSVDRLLPAETLAAAVTVSGPDPAQLGNLLGLPLPSLPPYRVQARLHRRPGAQGRVRWSFEDLEGRVGDSDISGSVNVELDGARPRVEAMLRSDTLDFDDLAGLVGAAPDPEETASRTQRSRAKALEARARVLPDRSLNFDRLQVFDARVGYRAKRINAARLPLEDLALDMTLDDGHLRLSSLRFGVAGGTASLTLDADTNAALAKAKLTGDFDAVNLREIFEEFGLNQAAAGIIGGRITLWMHGDSVARWLASADGGVFLTMTGGQVDALLVELAGLDFAESLAVFLGADSEVEIECAYADLQARSGLVTLEPFLFETTDTKFKGRGTLDLRGEALDVTVQPHPKDFSLLSSRGPLHVQGTFGDPRFRVEPSFPSPEFGTADDSARCLGLVELLRQARKDQEQPMADF